MDDVWAVPHGMTRAKRVQLGGELRRTSQEVAERTCNRRARRRYGVGEGVEMFDRGAERFPASGVVVASLASSLGFGLSDLLEEALLGDLSGRHWFAI